MPNNILMPNSAPQMQIATPINDVQLVALLAAHRPNKPPAEAVAWAIEILIEAVLQGVEIGSELQRRRGE